MNAIYRINTKPQPIDVQIGRKSLSLARLLHQTAYRSAVILSGCNPLSELISDFRNQHAHELLRLELHRCGYFFMEGQNIDPCGDWPAEKSFLIFGIDQACACALGCRFRQNAIVWIDADAIPNLMMLR
ncbi:MAG: DUF3293 domain-containing protein [Nitrosomonas sp.]|nr:MAG: DUF3293 domain-containing protein [Nitrosomonas sp.]